MEHVCDDVRIDNEGPEGEEMGSIEIGGVWDKKSPLRMGVPLATRIPTQRLTGFVECQASI